MSGKAKPKIGRPSRIDDDVRATILDAVKSGLSVRRAAVLAGVSHTSVGRECDRNAAFRADLKRAEAEFEKHHVNRIAKGEPQWQSSAWLLERKFTDRWGKREPKPQNNVSANALFTTHAPVDAVTTPPGAVPALPRPEAIQDRQGGAAIGQDGNVQAPPGHGRLGALSAEPATH